MNVNGTSFQLFIATVLHVLQFMLVNSSYIRTMNALQQQSRDLTTVTTKSAGATHSQNYRPPGRHGDSDSDVIAAASSAGKHVVFTVGLSRRRRRHVDSFTSSSARSTSLRTSIKWSSSSTKNRNAFRRSVVTDDFQNKFSNFSRFSTIPTFSAATLRSVERDSIASSATTASSIADDTVIDEKQIIPEIKRLDFFSRLSGKSSFCNTSIPLTSGYELQPTVDRLLSEGNVRDSLQGGRNSQNATEQNSVNEVFLRQKSTSQDGETPDLPLLPVESDVILQDDENKLVMDSSSLWRPLAGNSLPASGTHIIDVATTAVVISSICFVIGLLLPVFVVIVRLRRRKLARLRQQAEEVPPSPAEVLGSLSISCNDSSQKLVTGTMTSQQGVLRNYIGVLSPV